MTLIELLAAIGIIGLMSVFAIPMFLGGLTSESTRGARRTVVNSLSRARGAAATRGCRSVLHLVGGSNARVWITSCDMAGTGLDTIGEVENLSDRHGIIMATSGDSVVFSANGLGASPGWISLKFNKAGRTDTLAISPIGWPTW
jgi:Tfp pilus assembly protein FimT